MGKVVMWVINRSVAATWVALAVLVLRAVLGKAPKRVSCVLWVLVAVRLVCPFSVESVFSLLPSAKIIHFTEKGEGALGNPIPSVSKQDTVFVDTGFAGVNEKVNGRLETIQKGTGSLEINPVLYGFDIAGIVWGIGLAGMLAYLLAGFFRVRRRVREAALLEGNIWVCDAVDIPFLIGIFRPRIYLPSGLSEQDRACVILHERAHIGRLDSLWKLLGFLLLCIHWFNPVLWISYGLFCRDLEYACDESVIQESEDGFRKEYAEALIGCSTANRGLGVCPLAFGEVDVEKRVKCVMKYKKPTVYIVVIAALVIVAAAVFLLTNPAVKNRERLAAIKEEYPEYFSLDASQGLVVGISQLAPDGYSCVLFEAPEVDGKGKDELEILLFEHLHAGKRSGLTIEEMRQVLAANHVPKRKVSIRAIRNGFSSYYTYEMDTEDYRKELEKVFWK